MMLFQLQLRCMLHVQEPQVREVGHLLIIKKQGKMSLIFYFFSVECTVFVEVQNEIHSKIVSNLFDFHFPLSANLNFILVNNHNNNNNNNTKVTGRDIGYKIYYY